MAVVTAVIDRSLKTGNADLDRAIRQIGDIVNWLVRLGILEKTVLEGQPAWTLPVVETVNNLVETVNNNTETIIELVAADEDKEARINRLENLIEKLIFEYGVTIRVPPLLANEFSEIASRV